MASRGCINNPNSFCYICGDYIVKKKAAEASWKSDKTWGNKALKDLQSSEDPQKNSNVSHLEYDFTVWPPKRISPIIEAEVDSLAEQLGAMVQSQSQLDLKRKRRREHLDRLRAIRKEYNEDK